MKRSTFKLLLPRGGRTFWRFTLDVKASLSLPAAAKDGVEVQEVQEVQEMQWRSHPSLSP
jgi:hypothetical protein